MKNLRLTIAYDGTHYAGWQIQPDLPTIQNEIQQAFARLTGESATAHSAGRTDAGVHALGQVASIRTRTSLAEERVLMGMQHFLPADIVVRRVETVPMDFHPAFSSQRKTYRYVMLASRIREPFLRRYAWHVRPGIHDADMRRAARSLVGRHDFRGFETQGSPRATTVRTLFDVAVRRCPAWPLLDAGALPAEDPAGPCIVIEVTGDGFLYNMVRAIAGTLYEVGIGKRTIESVARLLAEGNRAAGGQTAPARGLFLVGVEYGEEEKG